MATTPSATAFALRIDLDGVDVAAVVAFVAGIALNYLIVREGHDENPHVHAYLTADKKLSALRKSVQRFLSGDRGNAAYSLKQCAADVRGYFLYLCKGSDSKTLPDVVGRQGLDYTDDWVKATHAEYWVNNAAIVKSRQKRKGVTTATIVEKLEERVKERGFAWHKKKDIAREYIRMCKEQRKPINTFAARAIVQGVQVALCPTEEAIDELVMQIAPDFPMNVL